MTLVDSFPEDVALADAAALEMEEPRLPCTPRFEAVPVAGHEHHRHTRTLRRHRQQPQPRE